MPTLNEAKMKELVLYVASRLAGDAHSGSIKRNKVLAFADFQHYVQYGESITGAEYVKHTYGPAPRHVRRLEQELVDSDDAAQVVIRDGTSVQKMLFPQRDVDLTMFSGAEIASVEAAFKLLETKTGMQSSDLSHERMLGWKYAAEREPIPYETAFLYDGPVTANDRETARNLVAQLGDELRRVRQPASA